MKLNLLFYDSALDFAVENGIPDIVQLLLSNHNIKVNLKTI